MQQYFQVKSKHPDAILLFRVGDFYETFAEDAVKASQALGIVLTNRNNGGSQIALAGFPYHSLDTYLPRLVRSGYRVAICEQLEKPSADKKIVRRGVTEMVTPGIAIDDQLLDHKKNNYLAAISFGRKNMVGISFLDISTGEFMVCEGDFSYADKLFQSFQPSEVLFSKSDRKLFERHFGEKHYTFAMDEWVFTFDYSREKLLDHFKVKTMKGYGVEEMLLSQIAAGATLHYLAVTENKNLQHVNTISHIQPDEYVWLDRFTIRNLELIYSQHDTGVSLLDILDLTVSPMGGRLLKKWVVLPLKKLPEIQARLDVVQFFIDKPEEGNFLEQHLRPMGDIERLISKVPLGKINPREAVQIGRALEQLAIVKSHLLESPNAYLKQVGDGINPCPVLFDTIKSQLREDPPVNLAKGGVIADGFNAELDEYRNLTRNNKQILVDIQKKEAQRTGIDNLKIGYNSVFGYYLEVTNKHKDKGLVPDDWTRKQTLTNAERYITEELKVLESKILGAEEKILLLEAQLFEQLVLSMADYIQPIQHNGHLVARLDCLLSFARIAISNNYCRPEVNNSLVVDIKSGRHPVIEKQLEIGDAYVPNDTFLDNESQQILMITGPNMAGKSALLRQTALICLMAQMGSFVPAASAKIGLVDKVFTRVGASDNISSGESTFMVEMNETSSILNNISERSLILMDEIGRGTSTYDGVSIAWSIAEYLHTNNLAHPKTLFATHYHELNELANRFERIKNFNISVKEINNKVIFLRKLVPGGSAHSFGIHVAQMAGMPRPILERAAQILTQLEAQRLTDGAGNSDIGGPKTQPTNTADLSNQVQLSIFETVDPTAGKIREMLLDMDLNSMTPIECMLKINELRKIVEDSVD